MGARGVANKLRFLSAGFYSVKSALHPPNLPRHLRTPLVVWSKNFASVSVYGVYRPYKPSIIASKASISQIKGEGCPIRKVLRDEHDGS